MSDSNTQSTLSKEQIDSVIALYSNGQYQKAIDSIKGLTKNYPNDSLLHNIKGACYAGLGQLASAVKSYEKAISIDPNYAKAYFNLGNIHKESKLYDKAKKCYKKALEIDPNFPEVLNSLGNTYIELDQIDNAVLTYQKAIEINPNFSEAYNSLGNIFLDQVKLEDAIISYKKALEINPDFPALHNNLGNAYKKLGRLEDAMSSYSKGLALNPDYTDSLNNLGVVLNDLGQYEEAINSFKRAIEINLNYAEAYNNLGVTYKKLGQSEEAIHSYEKALGIDPEYADAYNNLGVVQKKLGQLDAAIVSYKKAIAINPNDADTYNNLGNTLEDLEQSDYAIKSYQKAIKLNPEFYQAHNNYGNLLAKGFNRLNDAVMSFRRAIEIKPDFAIAYNNLGNVYKDLNQLDEALQSYEMAMKIQPDLDNVLGNILSTKMNSCNWDNLSNLLLDLKQKIVNNEKVINPFTLLGLIDDSSIQLKATEIIMNSTYPKNNTLHLIENHPKHQKIRIGYFSGDFREHPVSYLTAELYEVHNRSHFEIHAFSFGPDTNDEMNLRIKAGVDHFHDVHSMTHKEIAELARSLEIDIAVDLTGHTAEARTDVFAMSAAPLQVNYLGYAGSMGLKYIDYLIADHIVIPKNNILNYTEKIVYLPNSYMVHDTQNRISKRVFTREEVGLPVDGFVFCCFNNFYKITPSVFLVWMKILAKVDKSVLWLPCGNITAVNNLKKEAQKSGLDIKRLVFAPHLPLMLDHLNRLRLADLFFDTLPFNAHTTSSDALKMGLPVLTYLGNSFVGRVAASLLNSANLPELITNSPEEYESLAIELATNPEKMKAIKDKLASNLSTAPLYDTKLFTKNLESAYTQMYEKYHNGLEPDHIYVE